MRTPQNSGADQAFIRAQNAKAALRALRHAGAPTTLSQLAKTAGLSRPTVESDLTDLTGRGWAEELFPDDGAMGRPARRFRFHAAAGHVAGALEFVELLARHLHGRQQELHEGGVAGEGEYVGGRVRRVRPIRARVP
ncbi:helix-turn-helix domain-containing protein [Streptomyces sp. NBC_00444]|uniref:helix-turn-helix domain-containing protein n=1 Tax=Streptomyces sp. NBC_00444 TaxID=2975744 RepID=UPI002E1BBE26